TTPAAPPRTSAPTTRSSTGHCDMSTFSGLSTALSSLIAQRQALEVHGQNIANANTVGYTRQRGDMTSVEALTAPSMFSSRLVAGNGVKMMGITRMSDVFLDARVRS